MTDHLIRQAVDVYFRSGGGERGRLALADWLRKLSDEQKDEYQKELEQFWTQFFEKITPHAK